MSRRKYNSSTLWTLYQIGGADLALRYAELSSSAADEREEANSDASMELGIESLRFYAGPSSTPPASERQFASRFPKSSTPYVYFQLDLKNPWKYTSFKYKVTARYYKPDGSELGEIETEIETNPDWPTFWHSSGLGWKTAGNWHSGTYRVEVYVDSEYRTQGEFTIYEDEREEMPFSATLPWLSDDWPFSNSLLSSFSFTERVKSDDKESEKKEESAAEKRPMAEEKPQGLGFEGWLNRLSPLSTGDEALDGTPPTDDVGKMQRLLAIDKKYTAAMARARPGLVNEQVLQALQECFSAYKTLLEAGPPQASFYSEAELRTKMADTRSTLANAYELKREYAQAKQHYTAAIEIYRALGKDKEVQRCQDNLARLQYAQEGNVDEEIRRLRQELANLTSGSVARAEALIELAGLYSSNGDDFEAEPLLLEAEKILESKGGDPSGGDLANALTSSLLSVMQGQESKGMSEIQATLKVNELYRELSLALARIYEQTDAAKAARYRAKATQRDSRANNDAFTEMMRRALDGDLGDA